MQIISKVNLVSLVQIVSKVQVCAGRQLGSAFQQLDGMVVEASQPVGLRGDTPILLGRSNQILFVTSVVKKRCGLTVKILLTGPSQQCREKENREIILIK